MATKGMQLVDTLIAELGITMGLAAKNIAAGRFQAQFDAGATIGNAAVLALLKNATPEAAPLVPADIQAIRDTNPEIFEPGPAPVSFTLSSTVGGVAATEVHEGSNITFTVTASAPVEENTVVTFELKPGLGTAPDQGTNHANLNDFDSGAFNPKNVTILAGQTQASFTYSPLEDGIPELREGFSVEVRINGELLREKQAWILDGSSGGGRTFILTAGVDRFAPDQPSQFKTTDGDDTFIGLIDGTTGAVQTTLTPLDYIDGGEGYDIFNINVLNGNGVAGTAVDALPVITVKNVDEVNFRSAVNLTANISTWSDVQIVNVNEMAATRTLALTAGDASNINVYYDAAGASVGLNGGKNVDVNLMKVAGTADVVTIGGTTAASGDVNVEMTGTRYTSTLGNTTLSAVTVTGGKTVSVTQKATSDDSAAAIRTTNNTITQGAITVNANTDTTDVTIKQDAAVTAVNATNTTGGVTETASVKFGAMKENDELKITVGGADRLLFTASKDLTAEEVATAFSNLIDGKAYGAGPVLPAGDTQGSGKYTNGIYEKVVAGWTSSSANGDTVVFTSATANTNVDDLAFVLTGTGTAPILSYTQGKAHTSSPTGGKMGIVAGAVTVGGGADAANVKTITVDGYAGGSASTGATTSLETLNLSNGGAFTTANASSTLDLKMEHVSGNYTQTAGAATLNLMSVGNNTARLTVANTTALNVSGTGLLDSSAAGGNVAAVKNITVTGTAGLNLGSNTLTALESVNTTGTTGTVTTQFSALTASYTGGAGVDNVTLADANINKAIHTGGGNDKVTLLHASAPVFGANGSINGGDGTADTISIKAAVAASPGANFATKVTNFERLELTSATGAQAVDTAALGNYNHVTGSGDRDGGTLTLNNLSTGATVRLTDSADATNAASKIIVNIKDADKSTTDVLNVVINANQATNNTADNHGTITAAEVETINISVVDGLIQNNTAPDLQKLNLIATAAKTISITGDTDFELSAGSNQKVTLIDASTLNAGLTVSASGGTATTIKGGLGNNVLKASVGAGTVIVDNKTGASAVITNDVVPGVAQQLATYSLTVAADIVLNNTDTLSITINGDAKVLYTADADAQNTADVIAGLPATITIDGITYNVSSTGATNITLTQQAPVAANYTGGNATISAQDVSTDAVATIGGTVANQPATQNGLAPVQEQVTVVLTDGTNPGLTFGDTMSLTVDGVVYTYTADAATVTMDAAATELAALINAGPHAATYNAGADTITITAATATAVDLPVSAYTITDATTGGAMGDELFGGISNDILYAGSNGAELTGNGGNDLFVLSASSATTGTQEANTYSTITDFNTGDLLKLEFYNGTGGAVHGVADGATGAVGSFAKLQANLNPATATFLNFANAAINEAGVGDAVWFSYGSDTFIVIDSNAADTAFDNGEDLIIRLEGVANLDNASFNSDYGTVALA